MASALTDRQLFDRLISHDSTSAKSNLALAGEIADYFDSTGARIEFLKDRPGEKANVIIRLGPSTGDQEGLTLSGHMDTVPAVEDDWLSDPFTVREKDDLLFARGSSDMKGFLAIAMNAARRASGLTRPLVLVFTYDEEVGCLGAEHLVESPPEERLPRATVIGEPTGLTVVRMHKGHSKFRVTIRGRSAHSGYPHLGSNAIESAIPVLEALSGLRHELEEERLELSRYFDPVPWQPLNIATITGGTAINIVPADCVIELGLRPMPSTDGSRGRFLERISEAVTSAEPTAVVEEISSSPPMICAADAEVHEWLCGERGQSDSKAVSFATDAGWLEQLGLECVLFGPGSIEVAHRANEFVPWSEMVEAARVLDTMIHAFCVRESS